MTLYRFLLAGFALIAPVACEATGVSQPVANKPVQIKVVANAQPGPQMVSPSRAAAVFKGLCLEQLPKFAGTEQAAASDGFVQHKDFRTYYHQRDNLSVKLIFDGCSMVFQSQDNPNRIKADFAALPREFGQPVDINNDSFAGPTVFRAFVEQQ